MSKDVRTLLYDLDADPADRQAFLDPTNWADAYAVEADDGTLVGFFEFDPADGTVEVGLGVHPEYTGRGLGRAFVEAGLEFARDRYDAERFELAVAAFNDRAISVVRAARVRAAGNVPAGHERRGPRVRPDGTGGLASPRSQ